MGRTKGSSIGFTRDKQNRYTKTETVAKKTVSCCVCEEKMPLPSIKRVRKDDTYFKGPHGKKILLSEEILQKVEELCHQE